LLTSYYNSLLGAAKLTFLLPHFIRFAQNTGDKWRQFSSCISLFLKFPDDTVKAGMKAMATTINQR